MITYDEALAFINKVGSYSTHLDSETLPLNAAVGRVLATDLQAPIPSPGFTNSAMDGIAYRAAEVDGDASGCLRILGRVMARPTSAHDLPASQPFGAVRIMTGAPVPEWTDTVIPIEHCEDLGDRVRLKKPPKPGSHIRHRGEDLAEGSMLLRKGTVLDAERLMVVAAFGLSQLQVYRQPSVRVFSTGDELKEPGEPLTPGTIYNSSTTFLSTALENLGLKDVQASHLRDDEDEAKRVISAAENEVAASQQTSALFITTGAVSAGEKDFIPHVARGLGYRCIFHKVSIRPGKPVFFAEKTNEGAGRRQRFLWLGLPGNAISTAVGWHAFARPLLASWAGLPPVEKRMVKLAQPVHKPERLRCFYRAELNDQIAWVPREQGSARLAATIGAKAYVELPEGQKMVPADTAVTAIII